MQRKATAKTRSANADEKRFMQWVKDQTCIQCGDRPVIVDHMYGSTFRHQRIIIGMWALLPLCPYCDWIKTNGSHREYLKAFGETQAQSFKRLMRDCPEEIQPPADVKQAIYDWNR